tara:strand:+ start:195 stop:362 length:168 start_codon:yes stop_codon:yes gene_type:complete
MRIKVEMHLDDYEWDGRTLLLKLIPSDYTEGEEPDPEEIITDEPDTKLKVIGKKS